MRTLIKLLVSLGVLQEAMLFVENPSNSKTLTSEKIKVWFLFLIRVKSTMVKFLGHWSKIYLPLNGN